MPLNPSAMVPVKPVQPKAFEVISGKPRSSARLRVKPCFVGAPQLTATASTRLRSGAVSLNVPLKAGTYEFATKHQPAQIRVTENTELSCRFELSVDAEGCPVLKAVAVDSSRPVEIKNPVKSFCPQTGPMGWLINPIADFLVDAAIESVNMADSGTMIPTGAVATAIGRAMGLEAFLGEDKKCSLPKINRDVLTIAKDGVFLKSKSSKGCASTSSEQDRLELLNQMIGGPADFEIRMRGNETKLDMAAGWLGGIGAEGPSKLYMKGSFKLDTDGEAKIKFLRTEVPSFRGPLGNARIWGNLTGALDDTGLGGGQARMNYEGLFTLGRGRGPLGILATGASLLGVSIGVSGRVGAELSDKKLKVQTPKKPKVSLRIN